MATAAATGISLRSLREAAELLAEAGMGSRGWRSSRPPGSAARAAGKVRIEGKDSVMQDGDVVEFRHS